ncbi:MAG TPA: DinB family protein [Pedobacter sp.]|uniref:DinB family protein n=1 Tax=Pedobacter sp. TaxID=1411316 RepID=UPI002BA518B3|nr:DinB family protein [Pedobacter sp.]HMI03862.1 DinB family protein [Pedobacter sp.]
MSDPIHQLWLYNNWANELILNSFKQNSGAVPVSCLRLFCHIVNAQIVWLSRINGAQSPVGVWDEYSLTECENNQHIFSAGIQQSLADAQKGTKNITYKNTQNVVFSDSLQDILLHVFNHGTYHRAQIAQDMKKNGFEPARTDYIFFKRSGRIENP